MRWRTFKRKFTNVNHAFAMAQWMGIQKRQLFNNATLCLAMDDKVNAKKWALHAMRCARKQVVYGNYLRMRGKL